MKKFLRTILVVLLLLGVGFMYVVKNPDLAISQKILSTIGMTSSTTSGVDLTNCTSYFDGCNNCSVQSGVIGGCTRMFCETPTEPKCLEYANTGIDLTNCVSYFDGCNNCTVENGKPSACTLMYCETPSAPKCNQYTTGRQNIAPMGIANPASTNCEKNGGRLRIVEGSGGQIGMCTLPNGMDCEERAYMRGECGGTPGSTSGGKGTICTMDAKICPDGSAVGRSGPNCEFAPCPENGGTACSMIFQPVCASVQVQCIKAPCPPIETTFPNKCVMDASKIATFLHDGECAK